MTPEERLRRAIAARAQSVEPSDDGLDRITEKLLDPGGDMKLPPTSPNTRWYLVAAAAIVLAGIAGTITLVSKDGDDDGTGDFGEQPNPTVTLDPSTSPSSTTTTEAGDPNAFQAIWPRPSSEVRFDDPVAAVNSWARFYMGLADPVIGEFQQGDNRSGEVTVKPGPTWGTTTAFVRQLDDEKWYVTGSITDNIDIAEPSVGDQLACPVTLKGSALAFEGTVQVRIDAYQPDGKRVEVGRGHVTGGGGPAASFDDEVACRIPDGVEPYGILTLYTTDEGEQVAGMLEAASFAIRLR